MERSSAFLISELTEPWQYDDRSCYEKIIVNYCAFGGEGGGVLNVIYFPFRYFSGIPVY